jgi:general secretion pathway protein D
MISVQPSTSNVMPGASFAIAINVSGVTNLSAFQFDLTFNPNVLSATSVVEGSFLSGAGSTFFISGTIGNGSIANIADTLIGPGPGANGSGTLVIIYFSALRPGQSSINLSNLIALNSTGGQISLSLQSGNVNVGSAIVPEPESLVYVLTGLLALATQRLSSHKKT